MKKLLFALALLAFGVQFSNAQMRDGGDMELTPYLGYYSSNLNGDNVVGLASRDGVAFGAHFDYYFSETWSLRTGLHYLPMGAQDTQSSLDLNYVAIPMNANWHFGSTKRWNLNFGFSPSFLVGAELDGQDVSDQTKSFQLSLSYGIGHKFPISDNFSLLIEAQNDLGITDYLENEDVTRLNYGGSLNVGGVFSF